ncbi:MAG: lipid-A-disaccharide synthase [Pseudomonadota bacterium]
MSKRIYLVAGEASGDVLGQDVANSISSKNASVELRSTGVVLSGEGRTSSGIDVTPLSVLGLWEGLRAYGDVRRIVKETVHDLVSFKPDVVVLIDSWGFTLRVAEAVRNIDPEIRLVKLVGPQVWATRPGRAKKLATSVDHLLCIHEFEVPFYEPYGLKTTVIGHPALSRTKPGNAAGFREKYNVECGQIIVAVFPGSRQSEVSLMGRDLIDAASKIQSMDKAPKIAFAPSDSIASSFLALGALEQFDHVMVEPEDRFDLMSACEVALACSGTITTEIALQGAPVITGYRSGFLTWIIATNFLLKSRYITLLNVAADDEIIPEFLQNEFNGQLLAETVSELLADEKRREDQIVRQSLALKKMGLGQPPAAHVAADAILEEISSTRAGV